MTGWHAVDTVIIVIYLIVTLVIGIYASKFKTQTTKEYAIAGKTVTAFALLTTFLATNMGGGSALGRSGLAWDVGAKALTPFMGGWLVGIPLLIFLSNKIRRTDCISLPDIMNKRYGKEARVLSSILVSITALLYVALCYLSFGTVFAYVGKSIGMTKEIGSTIGCIVAIVYTSIGGYYAVVATDVIQFVIFMGAVVLFVPGFLSGSVGGFNKIVEFAAQNGISMFNPFQGFDVALLSLMSLWAIVWLTDPMIYQRVLSGKDDRTTKKALLWYIPSEAIFGFALVIIAIAGRMLMPDLPEIYGTAEAVLPAVVVNYLPPIIAGLAFVAIVSILMSTIDSCLIVVSTTIMEDIIRPFMPKMTEKKAIRNLKWLTFIIGIVALIISYKMTGIWFAMIFALSAYSPAMLWPVVFSYTWEKATKEAAVITILSIFIFVSAINIFGINILGLTPDVASLIVGIPLGLLIMVVSSLLTYKGKGDLDTRTLQG